MPSALLRACAGKGGTCSTLVEHGRCAECSRATEQRRGSASSRGYTSYWSTVFRPRFVQLLIAAGIVPACGAALPGGPLMTDSACKAAGRLVTAHLHLDHDPPLRDDERGDRRKVCDPLRVRFLCASCHSAVTAKQMQAGLV